MTANEHQFAAWLTENYADQEGTPLGKFARKFAPLLPAKGDRAELRAVVEDHAARWDDRLASWMPDCFDVAWREYQPNCIAPGCPHPACDQMSHCGEHALEELL